MLMGILHAIVWALDTINYKKVLTYKPTFLVFRTSWIFLSFLFALSFLLFYPLEPINLTFFIFLFLIAGLNLINYSASQYAYTREKISVLTPYSSISSVFSIIWAFLFFTDTSILSFFIAILIVIISIVPNINFKKLDFNKTILIYIWGQIFSAIANLILAKAVTYTISEISFSVYLRFVYLIILMIIILLTRTPFSSFKMSKSFYWHRTVWAFIWLIRTLIQLYLIKNLGLIMSTVLWFLWMWMTLIMSYLFFWDKPSKKDLLLTIVITILVFLWFYFK